MTALTPANCEIVGGHRGGSWHFSKSKPPSSRVPSPFGRGCREAAGEGGQNEMSRLVRPHPALRATFSRREKDSHLTFPLLYRTAHRRQESTLNAEHGDL